LVQCFFGRYHLQKGDRPNTTITKFVLEDITKKLQNQTNTQTNTTKPIADLAFLHEAVGLIPKIDICITNMKEKRKKIVSSSLELAKGLIDPEKCNFETTRMQCLSIQKE
jgi:hypothetical protein